MEAVRKLLAVSSAPGMTVLILLISEVISSLGHKHTALEWCISGKEQMTCWRSHCTLGAGFSPPAWGQEGCLLVLFSQMPQKVSEKSPRPPSARASLSLGSQTFKLASHCNAHSTCSNVADGYRLALSASLEMSSREHVGSWGILSEGGTALFSMLVVVFVCALLEEVEQVHSHWKEWLMVSTTAVMVSGLGTS